jgi:mono/diheme cytochrome c family protein
MSLRSNLLSWLAVFAFIVSPAYAGNNEEDEPYLPCLAASYRDSKGNTAARLDSSIAFHWNDAAPDARLTAGEFRAAWTGHLLVSSRGAYRFHLFASGEIELKIAGRIVIARQSIRDGLVSSEALTLTCDYHPLELSFRRTEKDARLILLWSGPDFGLEPIPPRALVHPREKRIESEFERGRLLARVLRCGRCHSEQHPPGPGPALDRLAGHMSRAWLIDWLTTGKHAVSEDSPRRMPSFDLSEAKASALADWLLTARGSESSSPTPPVEVKPRKNSPQPDADKGERLFVSLGCLACHSWRDLGASGWLGGGDLTHVADKRPPNYFAAWLADPARINRDHRMPTFALSTEERTSLALFLAKQKKNGERPPAKAPAYYAGEGRRLAEQLRCAACHRLPESLPERGVPSPPRLDKNSHWDRSCLDKPDEKTHRPGYRLLSADAHAVRRYFSEVRSFPREGAQLLAESNCLACHAREGTRETIPLLPPSLSEKLTAVVKRYPDLASQIPAMTPPALNSVGDKLTDQTLVEAIARRGETHRPYLRVRMPRFPLADDDRHTMVGHLIDTDRLPELPADSARNTDPSTRDRFALAGGRLVSSDGFGCMSCHAFGSIQPSSDSINARGPDLKLLERRIRRPWFDRWVRNPVRIVPRMEMPSVQIPVAGVLDGNLNVQLDAVWYVLNLPSFQPPPPNPIRILRHSGNHPDAEPLVLTDLLRHGERTRIEPFLVGLANRHNVLFDLESGGLSQWSAGDLARQYTRGKTWFWEPGGATILENAWTAPDLSMSLNGRDLTARPLGQFLTEADSWQTVGSSLSLHYRLKFDLPGHSETKPRTAITRVRRTLSPHSKGFAQEIVVEGVPSGAKVRLHLLSPEAATNAKRALDGRTVHLEDRFTSRIVLTEPKKFSFASDGRTLLTSPDAKGNLRLLLYYESDIPIDRFNDPPTEPLSARKAESVEVGPGLLGQRLPLPSNIMPTGLSWNKEGHLIFCTLKGQVFEALDSNGDGVEDRLKLVADGLPAPFGVHADAEGIDISAKNALLRLHIDKSGRRMETVASGWGYSADYHDWTVGLPRNDRGEYFLGIPCQQDKRSPDAARYHGNVLRLTPRSPTFDNPRRFILQPISAGHRFPMGLALDKDGELFATDNQGNYKPFNELDHVTAGAHFGFINALERGKTPPPRKPSAIDIPHPWTRSVNGICFLYTPKELWMRKGHSVFGPLEGHLIGCEYDTRRLIRMTLQRVGDSFQGAAYPLSIPPSDPERGFLGPLVAAVSPSAKLYIGSIRDSGWGAGANVGEIVRVHLQPDKLPCGIAEVRATREGFSLEFFRPIDRALARRIENYSIQSYRREATPAYGGADRDRRTEKVIAADVSTDARRVTLKLAALRPGFVYELRLKNLTPGGGDFHPAEAYYTLNVIPK